MLAPYLAPPTPALTSNPNHHRNRVRDPSAGHRAPGAERPAAEEQETRRAAGSSLRPAEATAFGPLFGSRPLCAAPPAVRKEEGPPKAAQSATTPRSAPRSGTWSALTRMPAGGTAGRVGDRRRREDSLFASTTKGRRASRCDPLVGSCRSSARRCARHVCVR